MMVRFLAEGEAWSSAPDAGERECKAGGSSSARGESPKFDCHAEVQPLFCKESANREQDNKPALDCHAEVQPILCKESANREQDNKPVLDCHAEVQPILCKDRKIIYTVQLFPELSVIQTLNHDTSAHSSRA